MNSPEEVTLLRADSYRQGQNGTSGVWNGLRAGKTRVRIVTLQEETARRDQDAGCQQVGDSWASSVTSTLSLSLCPVWLCCYKTPQGTMCYDQACQTWTVSHPACQRQPPDPRTHTDFRTVQDAQISISQTHPITMRT